ncbi:MAG: VWA domain-containing protein [Clostridia bacterium]|nr:VWA domain-containing protein [Clostridia bacterium]
MGDFNFGYYIDLVICVDATGAMSPFIFELKNNADKLFTSILELLEQQERRCNELRIKMIVFRDYRYDEEPMVETKFFTVDESDDLVSFINSIHAGGGGDIPENALEALALAIRSDWNSDRPKSRQMIVMVTESPALMLGERKDEPGYPEGMPRDIAELEAWMGFSEAYLGSEAIPQPENIKFTRRGGRLLLLAPCAYPWDTLSEIGNTYWEPVEESNGCSDVRWEDVANLLVNMI